MRSLNPGHLSLKDSKLGVGREGMREGELCAGSQPRSEGICCSPPYRQAGLGGARMGGQTFPASLQAGLGL